MLSRRISQEKLDAIDFTEYLGINLSLEPQLCWIAREMCCAPLPAGSSVQVSKTNLVYFKDNENEIFTTEHPLTQRFAKVLEKHRIDWIAGRGKPHVRKLESDAADFAFSSQFNHLQLPCSDCSLSQSTLFCNQCISSYCEACFELLHACGARREHTSRQTAAGSVCSFCSSKQPRTFCKDCKEYFCFKCFEQLHRRGKRSEHEAMGIFASNGNVAPAEIQICDECRDENACLRCDMCQDAFCLVCFWKCHLNGNRRTHTATQLTIRPLCNQCDATRATLYCEQCQELFCSGCFQRDHAKGGRKLHLFTDACNILVLLEKLDPGYQEFMRDERKKVIRAISKIQATVRGYQTRIQFKHKRGLATVIQKHWRGGEARRKLMGMLDHLNWRKREFFDTVIQPVKRDDEALNARINFARKDLERSMNFLGEGLPTDEVEVERMDLNSGGRAAESVVTVKTRLADNLRESDKLRRMLSINVANPNREENN